MRILITFIAISLLVTSTFAQGNLESKKLNSMIEEGMKEWQIPGLSAVVVKKGEIVFSKAYGLKDIDTGEPVDENTLFNMGSTTKALIAISLGILVDRGEVNWEDKVVDHLPSFRLIDSYITAEARVKDLLTHNLGIENADLLWMIDSTSTRETLDKFKHAKKAYPLRGGFTYQNVMYVVAGELIQNISGQHWTLFVEDNIFTPLEMTRSQAKSADIIQAGNYVAPHYIDVESGLVKLPQYFSDQIGAAGLVWSTAKDIGNYLKFLVDDGVYHGDTIVQSETFNYLFKPHSILPEAIYPTDVLTNHHWNTYGLGWFQQDYRGNKLDFHTGSLFGLVAIAGLLRDHDIAVYVFANLDHAELRHAIMYKAIDLFAFNDDSRDWHKEVFDLYSGFKNEATTARKKKNEERVLGTSTSLDIERYSGKYKNKMLGEAVVSLIDGRLEINFNNFLLYKLEHWHYNTFVTNLDLRTLEKISVNFSLNEDGGINDFDYLGEKFIKMDSKFD